LTLQYHGWLIEKNAGSPFILGLIFLRLVGNWPIQAAHARIQGVNPRKAAGGLSTAEIATREGFLLDDGSASGGLEPGICG